MNILVIGAAGKMGRAVVSYLVKESTVEHLGILDIQASALRTLVTENQSPKLKTHFVNIEDTRQLKEILKEYPLAVVALPNRKFSYQVLEAAIDARTNVVDMLEEYHRRPDIYETEGLIIPPEYSSLEEYGETLHETAIKNNVLVLDGMGFAPGLSNITVAHGIGLLDKARNAVARVGGIPDLNSSEKHPLRYMTTWSLEHVLREYFVRTRVIKNGKIVEIQALSDPEEFRFQEYGLDVDLECAITPGMPSFIYTHPNLEYFAEKTIRWPGHYQGIRTLIECGLLDTRPVEIDGVVTSPRAFLLKILDPLLHPQPGDGDVCVMLNTIIGEKDGSTKTIEYSMWEQATQGFTAMARVTGFSAAIGAKLIGAGQINLTGIRAPEECITGSNFELFLEELRQSNIVIKEKIINHN